MYIGILVERQREGERESERERERERARANKTQYVAVRESTALLAVNLLINWAQKQAKIAAGA